MIPNVEDLRSSPLSHRPGEMFNPPALTNFLGVVQADVDPIAIRCLSFPPFATNWISTGGMFLNGRYFASTGAPVTFTWWPDRIVREARWDGWHLRTTTVLARGEMAALVHIEVVNEAPARDLEVRLGVRGGVTHRLRPWNDPYPPGEWDNTARVEPNGVVFIAGGSEASWAQLGAPQPTHVDPNSIIWRAHVGAGARAEFEFVTTIDEHADGAVSLARRFLGHVGDEIEAVREEWNAELGSVFTPDDERYGGSLPVLETTDEDLRKIYNMGALGVVYFKRNSPALGRTYGTLMPGFWQTATFLWDYSLSGQVHALLDPGVMRRHLEHWMATDVHTCFGTEMLTGAPLGGWYSVNDFAMSRMIHEYVRWTGDRAWLDTHVPLPDGLPMTVRDHLRRFATNWEYFCTPNGLADYGGINNLLECVSTYVHEVAALNAGNVFNLRVAASLEDDPALGAEMMRKADALVEQIQRLYIDGEGFWHTRTPDGSLVPVRHCYDFLTIMFTIGGDLSQSQREEMADFCLREFRTSNWMRALATSDPDASFSTRPDHQWNGAYTAWPPGALAGLWRAGRIEQGIEWMRGLARSANQGPFGQAHFVEEFAAAEDGGARKASGEQPYINDWACSSNGAWVQLVIESIFGVRAGLDGIEATPAFGSLDPSMALRGLRHQGVLYDVDATGIHRA